MAALTAAFASAGPFTELNARQKGLTNPQFMNELRRLKDDDTETDYYLQEGAGAARAYVGLRAALEETTEAKPPKLGPAPGDEQVASSWLSRTLSRIPHFDREPATPSAPNFALGSWATVFMWGVLIALAALAIYLLVRNVNFGSLKRRRKIVESNEPLRSSDAWLEEANDQIARGEYRNAVRGLYVAGLMRLDEAGVARFDRHQTNWEHLRRIEASSRAPSGLDVRGATTRFDRVWYGHLPATEADALAMRGEYDALVRQLAEVRA